MQQGSRGQVPSNRYRILMQRYSKSASIIHYLFLQGIQRRLKNVHLYPTGALDPVDSTQLQPGVFHFLIITNIQKSLLAQQMQQYILQIDNEKRFLCTRQNVGNLTPISLPWAVFALEPLLSVKHCSGGIFSKCNGSVALCTMNTAEQLLFLEEQELQACNCRRIIGSLIVKVQNQDFKLIVQVFTIVPLLHNNTLPNNFPPGHNAYFSNIFREINPPLTPIA